MPTVRFTASDGTGLVGDVVSGGPAGGVAVICHPLSLNGGSMTAGLIPLLQRTLVRQGWTALRFDFRGAGMSEGSFDKGVGEQRDLEAAVTEVHSHGDGPLLLCGWSFGAAISLRFTIDHPDEVAGWLGVGLPLGFDELGIPRARADELRRFERPLRFVHGTADDVAPLYRVRALAEVAPAGDLVTIEGGDHFLQGHRDAVAEAVRGFSTRVRPR